MEELTKDYVNFLDTTLRNYSKLIFRMAYQNLCNYHDAEDILQEVGLYLMKGNPPTNDETHLKRWIIKVTVNKCRDMKKAGWRTKNAPIDDYTNLQAPETQRVMEEVWKLPDNSRNIIYLYYYENYTISEIAEVLEKNPNTIGSQLRRARKKLKDFLIKGGYEVEK